jgi:hypothetical protein
VASHTVPYGATKPAPSAKVVVAKAAKAVPKATPKAVTKAAKAVPKATPKAVTKAAKAVPKATPKAVTKAAKAVAKAVPNAAPEADAMGVPRTTSNVASFVDAKLGDLVHSIRAQTVSYVPGNQKMYAAALLVVAIFVVMQGMTTLAVMACACAVAVVAGAYITTT